MMAPAPSWRHQIHCGAGRNVRGKGRGIEGSILPLVAILIVLMMAFLGLVADVMRTIHATIKLQSAVDAAVLGAMTYSTEFGQPYSKSTAQNNIGAAVQTAGGAGSSAWNQAPAGPVVAAGLVESDVAFEQGDLTFLDNPQDPGDMFVRLKARRDGDDSIRLFFLPAIFAFNHLSGGSIPQEASSASPYRETEAIFQPAARIGAGPPPGGGGSRAQELSRFATFPLALSNVQFSQFTETGDAPAIYNIDLSSGPAAGNTIKGTFANVAATGGSLAYYGSGQGAQAVNELINLIDYFTDSMPSSSLPPGAVERGSLLSGIDAQSQTFKDRENDIRLALSRLTPGRYYIFPIVRTNPTVAVPNEVLGFAYMRMVSVVDSNNKIALVLATGESAPVRNATHNPTLASVPSVTGAPLPPPEFPFQDRRLSPDGTSLEARRLSLAMAPTLSPRIINRIAP